MIIYVISESDHEHVYTDETGYAGFRRFVQKRPQTPVLISEMQ